MQTKCNVNKVLWFKNVNLEFYKVYVNLNYWFYELHEFSL